MTKIYFLFHSGAFWPSWASFWEAADKDPEVENRMIFCPVKRQGKGLSGQFIGAENFLVEKGIPYTHIDDIDFATDKPDYLVMQTPYDNWHRFEKHHSGSLKEYGMKLIYISYGLEFTNTENANYDHFKRDFFSNMWKIFSYSDEICEDYRTIGHLSNAVCLGHPKFDALCKAKEHGLPYLVKKRAGRKKVLVWHPHFPCLYSTSDTGEALISTFPWKENTIVLDYLLEREDIFTVFMPHHMFFGAFMSKFDVDFTAALDFQRKIQKSKHMMLWNGDYPELITNCDAYIGERSALTMEASAFDAPMCYMESNKEQYNSFGQSVLEQSTYATKAEDVIQFVESLNFSQALNDQKISHREKYFDKYFDGKCGLRILEFIKNNKE